ncbi:sodium pump decarboxylases, gamma subunit [Dethiosulfatibacter aminovorans DSM 17477]|uniref:Sodium pump decarboxylases, gamma subunit n=1 Tax=Dethiosulfatibacter aminovorans DSM 17477 TaxID=1121476 RepID=A0A1M6KVL4_9FIRM|nr:OadG family protein [Dethiosulfatibacter aminovorans]SHJ62989.1 sodium pump decarboxylases, gamma subunit [Dethiosulfatibacter aminovorans DSM 17477]
MYGELVTMGDAGVITLFSMGIVFATLLLISYVLDLFKVIFTEKKKETAAKSVAAPAPAVPAAVVEEDDDELVAVITAALAAHIGKSSDQLIVRSIVQTGGQQPAWAQAGRMELMK